MVRGRPPCVSWQLGEALQQRAESWLKRLYALSLDAWENCGGKASAEFDQVLWAYHIEPFILKEVAVDQSGYRASVLFELLLCAVGCPPEERNRLKVGQRDCCLRVRRQICETWYDKLHRLPPRINEAAAAMARYQANELCAAGLSFEVTAKSKLEPKPAESQEKSTVQIAPITSRQAQDVRLKSPKKPRILRPEAPLPIPPVADTEWKDIEISFLSDERVQIRIGRKLETRNYAEFGFQDQRTQNPSVAWKTLRDLAEHRGTIRTETEARIRWPKLEKRVQTIRRVFRKHFGISSDPIPFVESIGYKALFKIACGPSYRT